MIPKNFFRTFHAMRMLYNIDTLYIIQRASVSVYAYLYCTQLLFFFIFSNRSRFYMDDLKVVKLL